MIANLQAVWPFERSCRWFELVFGAMQDLQVNLRLEERIYIALDITNDTSESRDTEMKRNVSELVRGDSCFPR
jgi:hypothetical protein